MTHSGGRGPRVIEVLTQIAAAPDTDTPLPARLCAQCLDSLPVSGAAIVLMTADGPSGVVLAATDTRTRQLEELQFTIGDGPCAEASEQGLPVLEPDVTAHGQARWPGFGAAVQDEGVRAVFAFPLWVGAVRVGVLDLYRDVPGPLSAVDLGIALAFADAATVVVLHLQDQARLGGTRSALSGPVGGRTQVNQATGMISIQLCVGITEALLRLRAHAYAIDRPVSDVAADVVGRRVRFDDSEAGAT